MHPAAPLPLLLTLSTAAHALPIVDFLLHPRAPTKSYSVVNVDGDASTDAPPIVTVTKDPVQVTVTERVSHTASQESTAVQPTTTSTSIAVVNVGGDGPTTVTVTPTEKPAPEPTSIFSFTKRSSVCACFINYTSTLLCLRCSKTIVGLIECSSSLITFILGASANVHLSSYPGTFFSLAKPDPACSLISPYANGSVNTLKTSAIETPSTPVTSATPIIVVPPPWTETPVAPTSVAVTSAAEQTSTSVPVPPVNTTSVAPISPTSTYPVWTPDSSSSTAATPTQVYETAHPTTWAQETSTTLPSTFLTSIVSLTSSPSPIPTSTKSYDDGYWATNKYPDGNTTATAVPQ
ncbi:hypothetical protein CkaCkLH20_12771 [Colletotrichum karsti]|uniref:Uncharacterized protein n=1 Tax=Colletotrichum karsti TaxID=1095194 RepID=A0A9P6LDY2_9PEZI|nr:uncharacterized protein CkaCkLH20_12771 [Colletotrichum karsti]KAF9869728.1 hypothetical protein CkaCkLH20_12771 [Colletotrichum karsti]